MTCIVIIYFDYFSWRNLPLLPDRDMISSLKYPNLVPLLPGENMISSIKIPIFSLIYLVETWSVPSNTPSYYSFYLVETWLVPSKPHLLPLLPGENMISSIKCPNLFNLMPMWNIVNSIKYTNFLHLLPDVNMISSIKYSNLIPFISSKTWPAWSNTPSFYSCTWWKLHQFLKTYIVMFPLQKSLFFNFFSKIWPICPYSPLIRVIFRVKALLSAGK